MSSTSIRALKDRFAGADAYCLAAGTSLDFMPPAFFREKLVIGVNRVWKIVPCTFVVMHHLPRG